MVALYYPQNTYMVHIYSVHVLFIHGHSGAVRMDYLEFIETPMFSSLRKELMKDDGLHF
jgi:hypothetical protein